MWPEARRAHLLAPLRYSSWCPFLHVRQGRRAQNVVMTAKISHLADNSCRGGKKAVVAEKNTVTTGFPSTALRKEGAGKQMVV